jgi:hypothetical protein
MAILHTMQLHVLDVLFQQREKEVKQLIGNLQINEVKDDKTFEKTVNRIKAQTALTPVTIGEPKIEGNRQETRQVGPNYQQLWGGERAVNIVTVSFPVTGSHELFEYRASGGSLTMRNIYTPDYNSISMEIQVAALDKAQVLAQANDEISTTKELIAQNNPQAEAWTSRISAQIDSLAAQKRKELIDFYS